MYGEVDIIDLYRMIFDRISSVKKFEESCDSLAASKLRVVSSVKAGHKTCASAARETDSICLGDTLEFLDIAHLKTHHSI
jgi:hypothetical protein